jgi:hypothetical protein
LSVLTGGRRNDTAAQGSAAGRLRFVVAGCVQGNAKDDRVRGLLVVEIAGKFLRGVYAAVTLFAGHIVLNEIGVLQPHEFDGEAIFDVAHDAALRLADRDDRTNRWPQIR